LLKLEDIDKVLLPDKVKKLNLVMVSLVVLPKTINRMLSLK